MSLATALDREVAWLTTTGDGLPSLLKVNGGPFDIVQARWPRMQSTSKRGIYLIRQPGESARLNRFANQRSMLTNRLLMRIHWKLTNGVGSGEAEQLAFDQALDLVLTRIAGPLGDKTHGGRFLAVAENPDYITVDVDDPETVFRANNGAFTARISYSADDADFNN